MSAEFDSRMIMSGSDDDDNKAYVEVVLEIFEDSTVAIHSIEGEAVHEDPELRWMVNKALENRSSSSSCVGFSLASLTRRLLAFTSAITKS